MLYIYILFITCICSIYGIIYQIYNKRFKKLELIIEKFKHNDNIEGTVYWTKKPSQSDRDIIVMISGGAMIELSGYIIKTIRNVNKKINCPIVVYENYNKINILLYDNLTEFRSQLAFLKDV